MQVRRTRQSGSPTTTDQLPLTTGAIPPTRDLYVEAVLDEFQRTANTDLRGLGLGPQPQLLDYDTRVRDKVTNYYRTTVSEYLRVEPNPTLQGYYRWLSIDDDEVNFLRGLITSVTDEVITGAMVIAGEDYDNDNETGYSRVAATMADSTADDRLAALRSGYLQLRSRLLGETEVGRLLREGRYRDAVDLINDYESPQALRELQTLLPLLPAGIYLENTDELLTRAADILDPGLKHDKAREQLRPWLVSRLEQQYWNRTPTRRELQDYWLSPENLSELQREWQRVRPLLLEGALVELLDVIVARYADLSVIAGNRLNTSEISDELDNSDFREVSLGLLRNHDVVSAGVDDYLTNDDWLDEMSANAEVYGAILPTLRRYLGITREMIVDYATEYILEHILDNENATADVSDEVSTSPKALSLLTEWVRGKVSEAADRGVVTEEDPSIVALWNSLEDTHSGLHEVVIRARDTSRREIIELLVERQLVIFYGNYDHLLQRLLLDLISAVDGTPEQLKYLQLLDVISPVVMATGFGHLILSDPASARDLILEEGEPSPVVQESLEEVVNNLQLESVLYRTTGRNLTSRLVERGEIRLLQPPDSGVRRHAVVVDIRDLLPLSTRDGADLQVLLSAEESPLTYRSSAMPVLRRAVTLGYHIILHSIPPLTPPYLLQYLRSLLPSLLLVVLPWDLLEWRPSTVVGSGTAEEDSHVLEWSEASSLEVLLRHNVVPDSTSVLVVPRLPNTDDSTHRLAVESHNTLTSSLSVTWFDTVEIFPSTYDVRQLRIRGSQHTLLLVVPLGIDISDITRGMGLPRDAVNVVSHWGEIETSMTGLVTVLDIISEYEYGLDQILQLNFGEVTTALRDLLAGLDNRTMFNVRLVWYCGSPVISGSTTGERALEIIGDTTELLPLLDGPPVRYEA